MKGGENMLRKITVFALSLCMIAVLALPMAASAALTESDLGLGVNYTGTIKLGSKDVRETVASIINVALGLLGIVAVVIVLIGGFEWMTAGGNEEKTGEAKKRIIAGVIGLAIILSAYAIAKFAINSLVTATS